MSIDLVSLLSERVLQMEESATIKMAQLARDRYGMAHFPRLELASVLDKTGQAIRDDLQLVLESISA